MSSFDPFWWQKEESFRMSLAAVLSMMEHLKSIPSWLEKEEANSSIVKGEFMHMLQVRIILS